MERNVVVPPVTPNLRQSACTPLWYVVYRHRPNVHCVIHTHSMNAQLATLLDPTETATTLDLTHLEMLKGVRIIFIFALQSILTSDTLFLFHEIRNNWCKTGRQSCL